MSTKFIFQKQVYDYEVISRFGKFEGEQFEIRLREENNEWMAFLNFRDSNATKLTNGYNSRDIPELYVKPEQYLGTIELLRAGVTWFTLRESSEDGLNCWLSSYKS